MNLVNIFKMNDWNLKTFLIVIFSIQLAICGSIALNLLGINLPIIRQLISIIYLLFVPGSLCLRCLKIHGLSIIESLLYSIGLSITSLMFIGFFINQFHVYLLFDLSLIHISEPTRRTPISYAVFCLKKKN